MIYKYFSQILEAIVILSWYQGNNKYDARHIGVMPIQDPNALKQPQVGRFIRELRQHTGLTQEQFGKKIGVSYETVSRWENGRMQPSSLAMRQLEQLVQEVGDGRKTLLEPYTSDPLSPGAPSYGST